MLLKDFMARLNEGYKDTFTLSDMNDRSILRNVPRKDVEEFLENQKTLLKVRQFYVRNTIDKDVISGEFALRNKHIFYIVLDSKEDEIEEK